MPAPILAAGAIGSSAVMLIAGGVILVLFLHFTSRTEGLLYIAAILAGLYLFLGN